MQLPISRFRDALALAPGWARAIVWLGLARLLHRAWRRWHAFKLRGRTVLISGGASGLGRGMAYECCRRGIAHLIICDINEDAVNEAASDIRAGVAANNGDLQVSAYKVDVSSDESVRQMSAAIGGSVDVLINNAGIVMGRRFLDLTPPIVTRALHVNTLSNFIMLNHFLPAMVRRNDGQIVTIASTMGMMASPGLSEYNASKSAQIAMHESLRLELTVDAPGIRTLLVCPHAIDTGMFAGIMESNDLGTRITNLLLPLLSQQYVVERVIDGIEDGEVWLVLPTVMRLLPLILKMLPTELLQGIMHLLGAHKSMDGFRGGRGAAIDAAIKNENVSPGIGYKGRHMNM